MLHSCTTRRFGSQDTSQDTFLPASQSNCLRLKRAGSLTVNMAAPRSSYNHNTRRTRWEGCGQGVNKTQHDANGIPTIDAAFPDTAAMVKGIHGLGLSAGW